MQSSPDLVHLAEALAKAQASVRAATKSGENKFDKYRYAKYEDIANAAKPVLAEHGLSVVFGSDELVPLDDRMVGAQKDKAEHAVRVKVSARLLHSSGEWIESSAWGEGQDRADKAPYKAMTGAKKYLLAGLLAIPTTDDPESDENVGHGGPARNDRAPGSQPSTQPRQQQPAAAAQPGDRLMAAIVTHEATKPASSPTAADLAASRARHEQARQVLASVGQPPVMADPDAQKQITHAFKRAADATDRDQAMRVIATVCGTGVKEPKQVPATKVAELIHDLDVLAGVTPAGVVQ